MASNFTSVNLRRGHFVLIFRFSVLALLLAGMAFIFCRYLLEALLIGIFLMGPGNASIPLLLSVIRKHSLKAGLNATRLNTRACRLYGLPGRPWPWCLLTGLASPFWPLPCWQLFHITFTASG